MRASISPANGPNFAAPTRNPVFLEALREILCVRDPSDERIARRAWQQKDRHPDDGDKNPVRYHRDGGRRRSSSLSAENGPTRSAFRLATRDSRFPSASVEPPGFEFYSFDRSGGVRASPGLALTRNGLRLTLKRAFLLRPIQFRFTERRRDPEPYELGRLVARDHRDGDKANQDRGTRRRTWISLRSSTTKRQWNPFNSARSLRNLPLSGLRGSPLRHLRGRVPYGIAVEDHDLLPDLA